MSGRRGACPTLLEPMQTGDGLLARLTPVAGLSGLQLSGLARAAARFGNGIVEITARGSLQVRGLTSESTGGLAAQVDALGIAARSGLPVETNPLAGLDRDESADPRERAREIRERAEALGLTSRLGPKVSVTVDGGGVLGLGGMIADIKLEAVAGEELAERAEGRGICEESAITWLLRVGGSSSTARVLGRFSQSEAAEITLRVLVAIVENGPAARARDLGDAELAAITGREPAPATGRTEPCLPVGRFPLAGGGQARGFALAYGQIDSDALARFAESIGENREIRFAPGRGLLVLGLSENEDEVLLRGAEEAGLVVDGADPRLFIATCAGRPACTSAHLATKRLADRLVARRPDLPRQNPVHVSGCAKQCARPSSPAVTLLGAEDGHQIVHDGADRAPDLEALLAELAEDDRASTQGQNS